MNRRPEEIAMALEALAEECPFGETDETPKLVQEAAGLIRRQDAIIAHQRGELTVAQTALYDAEQKQGQPKENAIQRALKAVNRAMYKAPK